MVKYRNDYFDLPWIISLILAIFPLTAAICGIITRFIEGRTVAGIIRIIINVTGVGTVILWIADLVCIIMAKRTFQLI